MSNNTSKWDLVNEKVDESTIALYRNEFGDEIEIREKNSQSELLSINYDHYQVIYDPVTDEEEGWELMYQLAGNSFGNLDEAFNYAVNVLAGEELGEETVPEDWQEVILE